MDSFKRLRQLRDADKDFREIEDILDAEYPLPPDAEQTDDSSEHLTAPAA